MPEGLTLEQALFWRTFCQSTAAPADAETRFHSAFGVGSGTNAGAAEILSGRKSATSALPAEFAPGQPPVPGSLSILCGQGGRPVAIIETLLITALSLDDMDQTFIAAYGEFAGPQEFRAGLLNWYRALDPDFTAQTPLLAERFRVIWTGAEDAT